MGPVTSRTGMVPQDCTCVGAQAVYHPRDGSNSPVRVPHTMEVNLYYRADIQACKGARRILQKLADEYALHISEVTVEPGSSIKAPAIGVEGSRLQVLDSSRGTPTEKTVRAYLALARVAGAGSRQQAAGSRRTTDDGPQTTSNVQRPTFQRYMWQHRVGMIVGALSAFLGLAWIAPVF